MTSCANEGARTHVMSLNSMDTYKTTYNIVNVVAILMYEPTTSGVNANICKRYTQNIS